MTNKSFTSQGWQQFLTGRQGILDKYDQAKIHSASHKVSTSHGNVAEAEFRKWLKDFLPIRYGVTSGYIVSPFTQDTVKMPHFDIIIYDALNSPILWIEDNRDHSHDGQSRAIPVEYVKGVFEVKSSFNKRTVVDALTHIRELSPLYIQIDKPNEQYKRYLPFDFFCGFIFIELHKKYEFEKSALSELMKIIDIRGYYGSIILRGEGRAPTTTCKIDTMLTSHPHPIDGFPDMNDYSMLTNFLWTNSQKVEENLYSWIDLTWQDLNFSTFAFDLLALLNGTYQQGKRSSFYAFGDSSWII